MSATTHRTIALILSAVVGFSTSAATADDRRPDPASLSVMTINAYFMWDGVEPEEGASEIDIPWRHSQQEAEEHMAAIAEVIARAQSGHRQPRRDRERGGADHLE